ncbi:hypothetical protein FA10DRAFT_57860 [Acaromyces ingoldii]|uniref:Uncharacterized protein n=1 Tax=Acaromyces ingoldii TaxID=215250 RepID=A0A316Y879_9BASI|nr:hypothetical protein FA10DRAFT_57860 [Acaromyces ingoldii]PWN86440.1 hypothetical protein FA10DRAFT_57860 [Acaromyces ingoldii]
MHAIVRLLFGSRGIRSSKVFYPSHRVRFPQNVSISGVTVQWATLIITSPSLPGDVEEQDNVAQSQALLGDLAKADEELFAKLFEPSEDAEVLLDKVLCALEARGGFWTAAAHRSRPHPRNLHPDKRPEFMVQGVFPKPFLDRCLRYRGASHCVLPNDIDSEDRASLITATSAQQSAILQEANRDNLQGFSIGVTLEPINTGLPWESSGVGVMAGAAAAGGM